MSDAMMVTCSSCGSSLKVKGRNAIGKRVSCPKCKESFVVKAPDNEEEELDFLDDGEAESTASEDEEFSAPQKVISRNSPRPKPQKARPSKNLLKPIIIGTAVLAMLALVGGGGYLAFTLIRFGGTNKIDLTYLPPDCDLIIHARVDEAAASPMGKSILEAAAVKRALDAWATEYQIAIGDVKSVTLGLSGAGDVQPTKLMPMAGMAGMGGGGFGIPGMGAGRPTGANVSGVAVVRTSKTVPADFGRKIPTYVAAEYQGTTYYRSPPQVGPAPTTAVYAPAADVIVVADERQVQRIIDKGPAQTRRPEFDFIETSPHVVIAMLSKPADPSAPAAPAGSPGGPPGMGMAGMPGRGMGGMPGGGMPMMPGGGMPGIGAAPGADVPSLQGGKLKAWSLGITFTQDIEVQAGLYCPESAKEARNELEASVSKSKSEFAKTKGQLGMLVLVGLGDLVPPIEQTMSSLSVGGSGSVVQVTAKVPGSIKAALEKAGTAMAAMAPGGRGGPGAGLGGGFGGGFPPGFGNGPSSLGGGPPSQDSPAEPEVDETDHGKPEQPEAPQGGRKDEIGLDKQPAEPARTIAAPESTSASTTPTPAAPVSPAATSPLAIGSTASDFELRDIKGGRVSLSSLSGKPLVLVFWATWSGPSKEVLPRLQDWHDKYKGQGLTVLAINATEDGVKAGKLLKEKSYTFRCAIADAKTSSNYQVSALPLAVLLGSDGKIVQAVVGSNAQAYEALDRSIEEAVKKGSSR